MSLLAKAKFENVAGMPQELSFKPGEILTVLHQNPEGYQGWWICSVRGKVGIAPGNRLDLIGSLKSFGGQESASEEATYDFPLEGLGHDAQLQLKLDMSGESSLNKASKTLATRRSFYENFPTYSQTEFSTTENLSDYCFPESGNGGSQRSSGVSVQSMSSGQIGSTDSESKAGSSQIGTNGNNTARKLCVRFKDHHNDGSTQSTVLSADGHMPGTSVAYGDYCNYQSNANNMEFSQYDGVTSPKFSVHNRNMNSTPNAYISPPNNTNNSKINTSQNSMIPPQPNSQTITSNYNNIGDQSQPEICFAIQNSSSQSPDSTLRQKRSGMNNLQRLSMTSSESSDSRDPHKATGGQAISLSKEVALDTFESIQRSVTSTCNKLFRCMHSRWKTEEALMESAPMLKSTSHLLISHLSEFGKFCQGVLVNASECIDHALSKKICKHLNPFQEFFQVLCSHVEKLDRMFWNPVQIYKLSHHSNTDYLNHLVHTTRSISIEVRSLSTAIWANSTLLFPNRPSTTHVTTVTGPRTDSPDSNWSGRLTPSSSPSLVLRNGSRNSSQSPSRQPLFTQRLEQLEGYGTSRPESACSGAITPTPYSTTNKVHQENSDEHTFKLYSAQLESHGDILVSTMEELLKCLAQSQPPNVFVAHSKFLLKTATQMVHIANSLCSALSVNSQAQKISVETSANGMCEYLKQVVVATKRAAAEFPSLGAVQNLVVAVGRVRETAFQLRRTVRKAANSSV